MKREELEEKLIPLHWNEIDYSDEIVLTAGARSLNFWYNILEVDGRYTLVAENEEGTINEVIANDIETIEEAKTMAWDDFISEVLNLFE